MTKREGEGCVSGLGRGESEREQGVEGGGGFNVRN